MFRLIAAGVAFLVPAAHVGAAPETAPTPREVPRSFEVPYKLTDSKHVMIRVKLNGKGPFNFILDTGAPALHHDRGRCQKDRGETRRWLGYFQIPGGGGVEVPKARGLAHDMFQLKGMNALGFAGVELHGVIGYNILAKFKIEYDFTADKLIWTPLDYVPPKMKRAWAARSAATKVVWP